MTGNLQLLKQNLPFPKCSGSVKWFCHSSVLVDQTPDLTEKIDKPENIALSEQLKKAPRRLVFRSNRAGVEKVVVKAVPTARLRDAFWWKSSALHEAVNLTHAANSGAPVPALLGYGRRRFLGMRLWDATVMEDLTGHDSLRDLLAQKPGECEVRRLLWRVKPLVTRLALAGVNHVDFGPHAILLSKQDTSDDRVIDWQYASFFAGPSAEILAGMIGSFGWSAATNRDWVSPSLMKEWFTSVWDDSGMEERDFGKTVFEAVMDKRPEVAVRLSGWV